MSTTPRLWPAILTFVVATAALSQALVIAAAAWQVEAVSLVQFGPALGAAVTWAVFPARMRQFLPARVPSREAGWRSLIALAASAGFAAVLAVLWRLSGHTLHGLQAVAGVPFVLVAILWLAGAAGEEIGWRGLLQPLLEHRVGRLGAAVCTGLLWAIWHVPMFAMGAAIAALFTASTVLLSVLLAVLGHGSPAQRVAPASVAHWLVNLAVLVVIGETPTAPSLVWQLVAIAVVTAAVVALLRHRLTERTAPAGRP